MKNILRKLTLCLCLLVPFSYLMAQPGGRNKCKPDLLGTRSWIRVQWGECQKGRELAIYWSTDSVRPSQPGVIINSKADRYYIRNVRPATDYYIWLTKAHQSPKGPAYYSKVTTTATWNIDPKEAQHLDITSSPAVPAGMQLWWHDEFNDSLLNRNKWSTNYYSNIDYLYGVNAAELKTNTLPQPAYRLNGSTITLFTNDSLPKEVYDKKNNKKISSIQTYDWATHENLLDNSRGGYFEVRVKRSSTGQPRGLNTAFWFDSPGPDLKYYLEKGTELNGIKGIRPHGQVFEIDVFEYINAQFVLHGNVDTNGRFIHNLATHVAEGFTHRDNWVVHGILWTPTTVKHYINGTLIKAYTDKHQLYSPNHFMNVFLGSYGGGGSVSMEVDYIRAYQWPLEGNNELPNGGAEYSREIVPWEGNGAISQEAKRSGNSGFLLQPGDTLEQYVYLDHSTSYQLSYWSRGGGELKTECNNITPVTGVFEDNIPKVNYPSSRFQPTSLGFRTNTEPERNKKTVRIIFTNTGNKSIHLDDITLSKVQNPGNK
ncbi:glycoside hydrolase family 16 protein [Flavihumibacter petaseus]|uniref:GH16 domain-containing protein n=1 Tax=Flavihumibacter petaseus NBRC 106054 TaxID=1220578 RepID=A0A0E9MY86_9BACT|nr:glycoside hydrolase family 16 protein [Flavihumibacter petaseus]GAO42697.1 hypothetical protein FPE01S_01_17130 [Flavihumibacter petaseus NBRC 106054]